MKGFTLFSCLLCSFTVLVESHRFHSRQTEIASTYMQHLVAKQTHCSRTRHSICLQVFFPAQKTQLTLYAVHLATSSLEILV